MIIYISSRLHGIPLGFLWDSFLFHGINGNPDGITWDSILESRLRTRDWETPSNTLPVSQSDVGTMTTHLLSFLTPEIHLLSSLSNHFLQLTSIHHTCRSDIFFISSRIAACHFCAGMDRDGCMLHQTSSDSQRYPCRS